MDCGGWSFLSHMFSRNSYILLAAAVLLAVLLAWEADVDERGRMAAFFTSLGDSLALLALQPGRDGQDCPPEKPCQREK